jgi:hypothetical protein
VPNAGWRAAMESADFRGLFGFQLQRFSCPEIGHKLLEMTQGSTGESYTVSYQDFSAKMHD